MVRNVVSNINGIIYVKGAEEGMCEFKREEWYEGWNIAYWDVHDLSLNITCVIKSSNIIRVVNLVHLGEKRVGYMSLGGEIWRKEAT